VGARHALFPVARCLALSLSRASCSPTPLFAACEDLGLMAGPSRPLPAGIYRVRPLRPVRLLPAGSNHAGRGADTPATCVARVGTVTTGTAPAFGRALAPCYGSDLLPLRLHFALQLGDPALRDRPKGGVFPNFARLGLSPKLHALCAPRPCRVGAFLARWSRQNTSLRAGLRSSNHIPLGKLRQ
jgi:hypothetical protein